MLHTDIDNRTTTRATRSCCCGKQHITRLMESNAHWINHNIKFDAKFLMYRWNIKPNNMFWDTLIGAFV